MKNDFYSDFDFELARPGEARSPHTRTPFQQDRDRIIYSSSFRRLQAKTQVFFSGEYDFYRTRLTHSLEVAQIGRSICTHLRAASDLLSDDFYVDPDLVEAVCLSHDIGHPPFGHAGEGTIHRLMRPYGGFEGNAQTLRIITETIYSGPEGREGMNPTRAFVDGVMKYKVLHGERLKNGEDPRNHFLYDEQAPYVTFIFGERPVPDGSAEFMNRFRSIECQIMDWADDTAYSLNDVVDGIASGLITAAKIEQWAGARALPADQARSIEAVLGAVREKSVNRVFSRKVGEYIRACRLVSDENFMSGVTNRYAYKLAVDPVIRDEATLYADLSRELVFWTPQIYQLEFKGDFLLRRIFEAFAQVYLGTEERHTPLLPADTERIVRRESDPGRRARLICDYLAGMTDVFAVRTYKRLYDPDFGSIGDLV